MCRAAARLTIGVATPQATPAIPSRCRGVVLIKGSHDGASDRGIEHHRPAVHARQQVGETRSGTEVIHASPVSSRNASRVELAPSVIRHGRSPGHPDPPPSPGAERSSSAAFSAEAHCDHRQWPASRNGWTIAINELVTVPTSATRGKSRSRRWRCRSAPAGQPRSSHRHGHPTDVVIPQM